ncbi:MAG: PAS domain S-box protein [Chloracidobacterium sp.]|uniref:PAS domain S-box protein n=1 Tax=Chloracidobacterium validum TaxID=2821543 RepID=A0ABX8B7Q0_9BACT|nr:PAS domain S-box protein [Chloracidobacterium validum]QUW02981.1 PAS domain S-box protein [Chloracidobacterium validum]
MREILEPIAHQLQSPQDLDRVLSSIVQRAAESVTAVCARLWLIRRGDLCQTCRWANDCPDKRRCLHLKANFGIPVDAPYRRAPLTVLSGEQLARGGVVAWTPPPSAAAMLLDPRLADEQGVVSFMAHPLRVENRVLGLLAVFGARMFTAVDFETCAVQAAAASAAIRVAELANRVQRADATVRDKARESEQQSRLLTAVLTHSSDRAIVIEDLDGNILAFNEGARRAYGYEPEEVIGRATAEKLHAPDDWRRGEVSKIYQHALEQGTYTGDIRRRRHDGQVFVERTTLTTLRDEEGDPAGFIAIAPVAPEPAAAVLAALDEVAAVRRLEDFAPETLAQMCQLSQAAGAALFALDGGALSARSLHGESAFAPGLLGQKLFPSDAPELFRSLEQGQVESVGATVGRLLADASGGALVIPMLRQQVQAVVVVASPRPGFEMPLLRLARGASALLRWQLLSADLSAREQSLAEAEAAQTARYEALVRDRDMALAKVADLEQQVQSAQVAVQQAATARQITEERAVQLESKVAELEAEYGRLQEVCRQSEVAAEQARQATTEALARCEALNAGQVTALRERDLFKARVELLEADLRQTRQRAERSAHQHAEALVRIHELEGQLAELAQKRHEDEQTLAEAQHHYEAAHRQMMERSLQLEAMLAESQQVQSAHEAEIAQLATRLTSLATEVTAAQQERLDAQHQAEALRQDLEATQQLLTEAMALRQAAERAVAEIEERAAKLLSEVIVSQEEQARLIKEYEHLEAELASAKSGMEQQAQAMAMLEGHIDLLERSLATSEVARAALSQRIETLLEERTAWRQVIDGLEARLTALSTTDRSVEHGTPSTVSEAMAAQLTALQATLTQREAENASLRQRLALLQGTYRETVEVLQSRLDDLTKLSAITGAHRKLEDVLLGTSSAMEASPVIIVACDDEPFRATLSGWCQQSGYRASPVSDGDAALAALMLDLPHGIVLAGDPVHISETYRRVRRNPDWRNLPIVVVTPESFTGVSASPSTTTLAQHSASPTALHKALRMLVTERTRHPSVPG